MWLETGEVLPRSQLGKQGAGGEAAEEGGEVLRKEQEEIDAILLQAQILKSCSP